MRGLGRPVYVCPEHVGPLPCGNMGVQLTDEQTLRYAARKQPCCAVCEKTTLQDGWRPRVLCRRAWIRRSCEQGCYHRALI